MIWSLNVQTFRADSVSPSQGHASSVVPLEIVGTRNPDHVFAQAPKAALVFVNPDDVGDVRSYPAVTRVFDPGVGDNTAWRLEADLDLTGVAPGFGQVVVYLANGDGTPADTKAAGGKFEVL